MKYYSEILNEFFDSESALKEAESLVECTCDNCDDDMCERTAEVEKTPTKKQLAANVERADKALESAKSDYEAARVKVEELSKKYLEEVDAILCPAKSAVEKAQQEKYDAIKEFNKTYGVYRTFYTGDRAAREFTSALKDLNAIQKLFYNSLWR